MNIVDTLAARLAADERELSEANANAATAALDIELGEPGAAKRHAILQKQVAAITERITARRAALALAESRERAARAVAAAARRAAARDAARAALTRQQTAARQLDALAAQVAEQIAVADRAGMEAFQAARPFSAYIQGGLFAVPDAAELFLGALVQRHAIGDSNLPGEFCGEIGRVTSVAKMIESRMRRLAADLDPPESEPADALEAA